MKKNIRTKSKLYCPNCGFPLKGGEQSCPECGVTLDYPNQSTPGANQAAAGQTSTDTSNQKQAYASAMPAAESMDTPSPTLAPASTPQRTDWANYIYDCTVMFWRVFTLRYVEISGRASRREYWSFLITMILLPIPFIGLICLIPWICVSIRRMHDINRSGWWILCPIVNFLFMLKRSDPYTNDYGNPTPAQNVIDYGYDYNQY